MSSVANFATGQGAYDASLNNGPVLDSSANVGTGDLSLNAVASQYMSTATTWTPPAITAGNGLSFSGWFYPASYSGAAYQSSGATLFDISGTSTSVSMYCDGSGRLTGNFNGNVVTCPVIVQNNLQNSATTVYGSNNGWHFFCYTIYCTSVGTALQSIYLDASCAPGLNQATTINTTPYVQITPNGSNYIGYGQGQGPTTWAYFNGKVDDFRFYNRVLTPPEISVLYQYNYKSNTTPTIAAQLNYDVSYSNAVQIDVSGTFSGLDVSRNPTFSASLTGGAASIKVSAASLQLVGDSTWAYVDTTVSPDTSYSYTIKPYIMNTYGSTITSMGTITTTPVLNGFFNQATTLPSSGTSSLATTAGVGGWTFVATAGTSTNTLCNGSVTNFYTGVLPSTVTYYMDVSQSAIGSTQMYQNIGIYTGTTGFVSFYMWPKDVSYNASQTVSVSLGGMTLLNSYAFATSTANAVPYTSFNLPFSMTRAGTYPLTFTFSNSAANRSGINVSAVQVRMQNTTALGIGYKTVDPSNLMLYYNFDTSFVSVGGYSLYDSSNGTPYGSATLDASMVGGASISSTSPASLMGVNSLYLPGKTSYAQIGKWTLPVASVGAGFSITGWIYRGAASSVVESSNATVASFGTSDGSYVNIFMNQRTGTLDFSCNGVNGAEYIATQYPVQSQMWSFFAMTCLCTSTVASATQCNYSYYMNDLSMQSMRGSWPNKSSVNPMTFVNNFLGGVPSGTVIAANSAGNLKDLSGNIDDFRVYNRALSKGDIDALWSYGFALNQYANLIDPMGLGMYYPMDPGSDLLMLPSAITSVLAYNAGVGMFDVSWIGGVGIGVTYTYDVSSSGAIVKDTSYSTTALVTINPTRITLTNNAQKTYTVVVKATNPVGTVVSATSGSITTLSPTTVTFAGYSATTTSNGYSIFVYTASKTTAISFTGNITFNVLLVGGGGSGGCDQPGGGGAGGVLQSTISVNATDTISITIGAGGVATTSSPYTGNPGANSTFNFTTNTSYNVTAIGGGRGASYPSYAAGNGGSGGGGSGGQYGITTAGTGTAGQGNNGGTGGGSVFGGGGGGAGTAGVNSTGSNGVNGGDGKKCTLVGITTSAPYGNYYWGGGGGSGTGSNGFLGGNGGIGGGGGGACTSGTQGTGGGSSINSGGNGTTSNPSGGAGGANTGGGGGGSTTGGGQQGGAGGSGIAIISVLSTISIIS